MKSIRTGMEWPLVGLFFVAALVVAVNIWQQNRLDYSIALVEAEAAGQALPVGWTVFGEIGATWIVKAALGAVLAGAGTALVAKLWQILQKRKQGQGAWRSGPNANFQRQSPPAYRGPSEAELYRAMLMQQMQQNGSGKPKALPQGSADDEPEIIF